MSEPILSVRGLTKEYVMVRRTLQVLRGVDLEVARGEFLALRGASGAGKSTLLHLMGGLDKPNAGEIIFAGQNLAGFTEAQLTSFRNRQVGFVFQSYHLLPELDALENACPHPGGRGGLPGAGIADTRRFGRPVGPSPL